jgi:hypothetical protein
MMFGLIKDNERLTEEKVDELIEEMGKSKPKPKIGRKLKNYIPSDLDEGRLEMLEKLDAIEEEKLERLERLEELEKGKFERLVWLDGLEEKRLKRLKRLNELEDVKLKRLDKLDKLEEEKLKRLERLNELEEEFEDDFDDVVDFDPDKELVELLTSEDGEANPYEEIYGW